jgi:glycosyltransferase involved in cell wall biosynthesis
LRVLLWSDPAYEAIPGGHRVQLDRTSEALKSLGVDVSIEVGTAPSFNGVDLVHGVGAPLDGIRRARVEGLPVAVSTIFCSRRYELGLESRQTRRRSLRRGLGLASSTLKRGIEPAAAQLLTPITRKQLVFESADLLLPNSQGEARAIAEELGVSTPVHIVPNGADARIFTPPDLETKRDGVLYVGRVDPHKNQLSLIKALAGTGMAVTIVGEPHPNHLQYYEACRRAGDGAASFLPSCNQTELAQLYQLAAVHAMPSWFETTGLASLEAALCGAAVVSTSRGYAREYLGDLAHYCDPADLRSIRIAVERALNAGPSKRLRGRVLTNFTWDHAATETLLAYNELLHPRAPRNQESDSTQGARVTF